MRQFTGKLDKRFEVLTPFMVMACLLCAVGQVLVALQPLITLVFVVGCTSMSFRNRVTALMSVTGLALYGACWLVPTSWGFVSAQLLAGAGILMWSAAFLKLFRDRPQLQFLPVSEG